MQQEKELTDATAVKDEEARQEWEVCVWEREKRERQRTFSLLSSAQENVLRVLCVAVCRSVLQCVAACCSVLQCVTVCCSVLQCVAVCCSVLQRVLRGFPLYISHFIYAGLVTHIKGLFPFIHASFDMFSMRHGLFTTHTPLLTFFSCAKSLVSHVQ